jgi:hypothetical protein
MQTGFIYVLLLALGIVPLALILLQWRKIVNPVIKIFYELITVIRKRVLTPRSSLGAWY